MRIPFNQPIRNYQQNHHEIDHAIARVLNSGRYILGEEVEKFEDRFSDYCGVEHCTGVASGTDALLIGLRAAGVRAGHEVITTANAGGYSSIACLQIGAVPVFVDVDPATLVLDPNRVISAITPKTRAIVATHLFGNMVDMPPLQTLAATHGVMLIEDCAQAHGAMQHGKRAGTFGSIGVFSFYPTKNLGALGDGGALVCSDADLACAIRELRQYGWSEKYVVCRPFGINSRLDPLQAAILATKLPFLDATNERRRAIVALYMRELADVGLTFCHHVDASYAGHLCVVRHPQRDSIRMALNQAGIGTDIHYPLLDCDQPGLQELTWRALTLPVSRKAAKEIFSLPVYPELQDEEVAMVCAALKTVLPSFH